MVTSSSPGSSSVWDFFTETEPGKRARCDVCSLCLPMVMKEESGLVVGMVAGGRGRRHVSKAYIKF